MKKKTIKLDSFSSSLAVSGRLPGAAFSPLVLHAREIEPEPVDNMTWPERVKYIAMYRACVAARKELGL